MAALPYMQLYVADYLADTAHLTTEEHGAYLLLLFSYWQTGKPLRADRLASVSRLSNERWTDVERTLEDFFHISNGTWTHFRVEADLEKVGSKSKKNSESGKASARARALAKQQLEESLASNASTDVPTNVATNVERTHQRNVNHARSGDTDTDTDTDTEQKQDQKPSSPSKLDDGMFQKFWSVYPNKKAKGSAEKAWAKIKPDQLLSETIVQAVMKQRASEDWTKDGGKFVPHPATWLNAKRWEDEVKPAGQSISKHSGFSGQRDYEKGLEDNGDGTFGF